MSGEISSEDRLREGFEQAPVGIAHRTLDDRWIEVNPSLCVALGYTREELLARSPGELRHPEDLAAGQGLGRLPAERSDNPEPCECRLIRKDGSPVSVRISTAIVRGPQGAPRFLVDVIEDIGLRKLLESEFLEAQNMEAISRLAGGIAHDFNNVLTAIDGYGQLLRDDLAPADPHRSDVEEIILASKRAVALTQQLLAFSRRQALDDQVVDLAELIRDMDKGIRRLVGSHIELAIHAAGPLQPVLVDPQQFEKVVLILIGNAADAMPGQGQLRIDLAVESLPGRRQVTTGALPAGEYVTLSVSDTGVHTDVEPVSRIFEPFLTTRGTGKGNGLGLSMVYGIIKQSGGNIAVERQPGGGMRFRIYLPAVASAPEPGAPRS